MSDGNSSSKGVENKLSFEVGPKLQIDGSWNCAAQSRVLAMCGRPDDLSFVESSVKDITDKGRTKAAAYLQKILEQLLGAAATQKPERTATVEDGILKRKASALGTGSSPSSSSTAPGSAPVPTAPPEETDMRQEVRKGLNDLQKIRLAGGADTSSAIEILHRLDLQPMSLSCLKITKIAAEVNDGFWKNNQVAMIRDLARELVQRWRSLYRAETGTAAAAANPIGPQRLRTTSMFLEESCHTLFQKVKPYASLMEALAERLEQEPQTARELAIGGISSMEFVKKVCADKKRTEALKLTERMHKNSKGEQELRRKLSESLNRRLEQKL